MQRTIAKLWLSGFGTGYLPLAPASWGSLLGALIGWQFATLPWEGRLALWIAYGVASISVIRVLQPLSDADPRWCVADEILAMLGIGALYPLFTLEIAMVAFVFFRFWDIVKLWPADRIEDLPLPWGIFADDIVAAIYTVLCLYGLGL